jgi:pimeloyl-ACP methyl ester carboxylesterase
MPSYPLLLIHGYSASGDAFDVWRQALAARGRDVTTIHVGNYKTLTNEISIRDLAEGFDRALRATAGLDDDEPFDAIVHSTGSLVLRAWLTHYADRRDRLKHFIGLAPANFGSPMAHKGRSWLGAIFKGNKTLGPDFLEAGDRVLTGLELGSRFQWDLAHRDLLGDEPFYGPTRKTPYAFVIVGDRGLSGIEQFVSPPASDGVVRWSGCALDLRKIELDLTRAATDAGRVRVAKWSNTDAPLMFATGVNHSTILSAPTDELVDAVEAALEVNSRPAYEAWRVQFASERRTPTEHQQFIVRVVDERGDPVSDYNLQLFSWDARGTERTLGPFSDDAHTNGDDASLRCFHVDLEKLKSEKISSLGLRILASSGTELVAYRGIGADEGDWDGVLDLSALGSGADVTFFYPFTTTFIEITLNREPMPPTGASRLFSL